MPEVVTFSPRSPGRTVKTLGRAFVEQLGMRSDAPGANSGCRILADPRAMLDGCAHMGVAGDAQAREQANAKAGRLLK